MAILLSGCQADSKARISSEIGVDLSKGEIISESDNHGGFHGDGTGITVLEFSDNTVADEIKASDKWRSLPLSENLTALVYGISDSEKTIGPYLADENGKAEFPIIKNGSYFFFDRHRESENPYDDSEVFDRSSTNFTIALYDFDENKLYFARHDT